MILRLAAAVLLFLARVNAQQPGEVYAAAGKLYDEQGHKAALPEFEKALALFQKARDRRGEAMVLGDIGNCYWRMGELPKALDFQQRALAIHRQLGAVREQILTHNRLGLVYKDLADYRNAEASLNRAAELLKSVEDRSLHGRVLNNLALVFDERGDYRRSLDLYQQALEHFRASNHTLGEAAALGNIGGISLNLGRFAEARRAYERSIEISERNKRKEQAMEATGNLALCLMNLGQTDEALAAFDRAIRMAQETGSRGTEADWHKGKGSALLNSGKYSQAREEYEIAAAIYEKARLRRELVEALNDMGTLFLRTGDIASAEAQYRRAIEISRAIGHPRGVTNNLLALASIEKRRDLPELAGKLLTEALAQARHAGNVVHEARALAGLSALSVERAAPAGALTYAAQALEAGRKAGGLAEAWALLTMAEAERNDARHAQALDRFLEVSKLARAAAEQELGWRANYGAGLALEALSRDKEAEAAYREAVSILETVRGAMREDRFRAGYLDDKYQVYVSLVRLLLRTNQVPQAFQFAERLRARSLASLTRQDQAGGDRRMAELAQRIRTLHAAMDKESEKPREQRSAEAASAFAAELQEAEREYQILLDDARSAGTAPAGAVPPVDDLQRALLPGFALVSYFLSPDAVSVFVLTPSGLRAMSVPVAARDLRGRVELLRDLIVRPESAAWRKPAESLWRTLIGPVLRAGWLDGIKTLVVVPHGILNYVPFSAFADPGTGRLLVEDFAIAHLPAAGMLIRENAQAAPAEGLLAAAPARARLQYARQEAAAVSRSHKGRRLLLAGAAATEAALKREAERYGVLHLATHAELNKANPLLSAIELERGESDDGRLEVHEIQSMRLRASLVTLSACETAIGAGYFTDVPPGDDFVGLTQAFLAAGSRAVVASLWSVYDRSTMQFMTRFYQQRAAKGETASLAETQRRLLAGKGPYRHPYYWAPFILVGRE